MNIEDINKKHYLKQELFNRVNRGLASRLMKYEDGVMHIELEIRRKWQRSVNASVTEIAHNWKQNIPELQNAIACKVYIIDSKAFPYKRSLQHLGIKPGYDYLKGILFSKGVTN